MSPPFVVPYYAQYAMFIRCHYCAALILDAVNTTRSLWRENGRYRTQRSVRGML